MRPMERLFRKTYAPELLRLAENDLLAARALAAASGVRPETALLMAQQAIEKSLKSVLCASGKPIPLTHDLYALIERFDEESLPPHGYELDDLTPYATIRRYEEGTFELTQADITKALQATEDVLAWCKKKLESNGMLP